MSEYITYRCDWCDFEDSDSSYLVDETDAGEDLCADCAKTYQRRPAPADQEAGQ